MACGNNIRDVIIAHWHVISGDPQTSRNLRTSWPCDSWVGGGVHW